MSDERLSTADFINAGHPGSTGGATMVKEPVREEGNAALFNQDEAQRFRTQWTDVQAAFVDEPRKAVEQADSLVASAMKRLAEVFSEERQRLEGQWDRGDDISTEDLRLALQRYRSFFNRLLSM